MTGHHPFSELRKSMSPERQERIRRKADTLRHAMTLDELRKAREQSQKDLAAALKVQQPAIAKLEKRADMYVSNLRRYIEALGGTLEITARFPDRAVAITNFSDLGKPAESEDLERTGS